MHFWSVCVGVRTRPVASCSVYWGQYIRVRQSASEQLLQVRFITTAHGLLLWRWIPYLCIWSCTCECVCVCVLVHPTPTPVCILIKVLQREAAIGLRWLHPRQLLIGIQWTLTNSGNNINGEWQDRRNNSERKWKEKYDFITSLLLLMHLFACSVQVATKQKLQIPNFLPRSHAGSQSSGADWQSVR